jgi:hypothetical protein
VYEGDIVVLSEYPENFAIASHGWYEYEQTRTNGWYFILLPRRETIPAANVNVSLLTVVTSTPCTPPCPTPIPDPDEHTQHRTFITYDTIAQRDGLTPEFIPNGRIVRVNDAGEGHPEYYEWDAQEETWRIWDIQEHLSSIDSHISESDARITEAEKDLETRRQNDILENALSGLPEMTEDELNQLLETRLNGN